MEGHPECEGYTVKEVLALPAGIANWDAEFFAEDGRTMSPDCKRALLGVKQGVQKRFDLAQE
jgi:hypothetical protein